MPGLSPADAPLAPLPDWLLEVARGRGAGPGPAQPVPPAEWRALAAGPIREGSRNTVLTRLAGYLLRRGADPYVVLELLQAWNATRCHPPLPHDEVHQTVASVARAEARRRRERLEGGARRGA